MPYYRVYMYTKNGVDHCVCSIPINALVMQQEDGVLFLTPV